MHSCIISLAANTHQEENLAEARERLSRILLDIDYTIELWTEPYNAKESKGATEQKLYLNQLAFAQTELSVEELAKALKEIERSMGRNETDRQSCIVRIDLDLMQYDQTKHHLRDWERPYIQELLNTPTHRA
jgi:2-amino-4-hydroxy-6-hydroxymethyldihydropteridine diphosphokinase